MRQAIVPLVLRPLISKIVSTTVSPASPSPLGPGAGRLPALSPLGRRPASDRSDYGAPGVRRQAVRPFGQHFGAGPGKGASSRAWGFLRIGGSELTGGLGDWAFMRGANVMKRLSVLTVAICVLWAGAAAAQTSQRPGQQRRAGSHHRRRTGTHRRSGESGGGVLSKWPRRHLGLGM